MAVLDSKKTYKNLKKKGFVDAVHHSVDHKYLELIVDGKLILHTKLSHGSKTDLGNYLIKQMARQCGLSTHDFMDLANCPLSAKAYLELLQAQGYLD